jgi:hypothetical protein
MPNGGQTKPWEDYQAQPAQAQQAGPWQQYSAAPGVSASPLKQYSWSDLALGALPQWLGGAAQAPPATAYAEKLGTLLPAVGGTVGGILGAGAGAGIASIPVAAGGAALGGAAGEAARQLLNRAIGAPTPESSLQAAREVGAEAGTQAGTEALGGAIGAAASPIARGLTRSAEEQMYRFLAPRGEEARAIAQKVAPELVERRFTALTRQGFVDKAGKLMDDAGQAFNDELSRVPPGYQLNQQGILKALDNAKAKLNLQALDKAGNLVPASPQAEPVLKFIDGLKDIVQNADPSFMNMLKIRRNWDQIIDVAKGFNLPSDRLQTIAQKYGTDEIRAELAKATPDLKTIGQEFSLWKNVTDLATDMGERYVRKAPPRLLPMIGAGAGAVTGGPAGAILGFSETSALQRLFDSAAWQTMSAASKSRLADAITSGSAGRIVSTATRLMTAPSEGQE